MSKNISPNEDSYIYYSVIDNLYNTLDRNHVLIRYIKNKEQEIFKIVYNNANFQFENIKQLEQYFNIKLDYLYESSTVLQ